MTLLCKRFRYKLDVRVGNEVICNLILLKQKIHRRKEENKTKGCIRKWN